MNIAITEKYDLFDIGILIKKTYESYFTNQKIQFVTLFNNDLIDVLILENVVDDIVLKDYFKKLKSTSIIIVNIDNKELIKTLLNENYNFISYGFNPKACITLSSFKTGEKDTSVFCVQRDIETINGDEIIEQEFLVYSNLFSEFDILLTVSVLVILGLSINSINNAFLDFSN